MTDDAVQQVINGLALMEGDEEIPKNVRSKIREAMDILLDDKCNISLRLDRSIEGLGEIADDPNLQPYVRMQLWSLVSQLESR